MRILCAADIHIGRTSTKLPDELDASGFTCSGAWKKIVDCAISSRVECVVLAGDIVDRGNSRFEALGSIEKGISLLKDAKIPVYAVTGNHDQFILPHIANYIGNVGLKLLGADGNWECVEDIPGVRIAGKSFTRANSASSLLDGFPISHNDHRPTVAIMHSSLSNTTNTYMPVSPEELKSIPQTVWVVGHIHQTPAGLSSYNIIVPGSPQALSPRETGAHGVYIADIDAGGIADIEWIPVSSARYERLDVSLEGMEDELEIQDRIRNAIDKLLSKDPNGNTDPDMLSLRIVFTGRTALYRSIGKIARDIEKNKSLDIGQRVCIESIETATAPPIDLEHLAEADDVPGRLAALIRSIDNGTDNDELAEIMIKAGECANSIYSENVYSPVFFNKTQEQEDQLPDAEQLKSIVRNKAFALLSELIAQRDAS